MKIRSFPMPASLLLAASVAVSVALSIAVPAGVPAIAASPKDVDTMPRELDRYIAKAVKDWDVPGLAIAIVKDDKVVAAHGYGVRELGKPEPVDGETIFDVASLTKSFTAAGAAVLVDEGKLGWDDRVRDRLPSVTFADPYIDHEVTLRDLLSHRTGLQPANAVFRYTGYDRAEVLRRVRFLEPKIPFRTGMQYSNILYTVAGEMIGAAAGTSWADVIRTRLLEPAGMTGTSVETRPTGPNVATPHAILRGVQRPIRPFDFTMVGPSSSIFTNAVDLARWLRLHINDGSIDGKQVISRASTTEMHSQQILIHTTPEMRAARNVERFGGYGLGWQVMDYRGEPLLWHTGNADGMPAYMAILPAKKFGVAVMLNSWGAMSLHGAIVSRVLDTYLKFPPRDWSGEALARRNTARESEKAERAKWEARRASAPEPGRPLSEYAGAYDAKLYGDVFVRQEGDSLTLQMGKGGLADLSRWDRDELFALWRDPLDREFPMWVVFGTNDDGKVVRLSIQLGNDEVVGTKKP